jgi:hypothetical protein
MGRQATAIHYHLNLLHAVGIVRIAGRRRAGRRMEALYQLAVGQFAVAGQQHDKRSLRQPLRTLGATLRLAEREAGRALRGTPVCSSGPGRTFHCRRMRAPLTPDQLRRVNDLLDDLDAVFSRAVRQHARTRGREATRRSARPPGAVLSLTFVLTPAGTLLTKGPPSP